MLVLEMYMLVLEMYMLVLEMYISVGSCWQNTLQALHWRLVCLPSNCDS